LSSFFIAMNLVSTPLPLLALALALALAGCATEPPTRGPQGSFSIKVVPFFGNDVRVYARAFERVSGQRGPLLAANRVAGDGVTSFVLPLDKTYTVQAFADLDGNGKPGPDEPAANLDGLRPEGGINVPLVPSVVTLPGAGVSPDWPQKKGADANPAAALGLSDHDLQRGLQKAREVAPELPIPPPPPSVSPPAP
jgi:hypothetical protein